MEKNVLEVMFKMYMDEATTIFNEDGASSLLTDIYVDVFQSRSLLLWVKEHVMTGQLSFHKAVKQINKLLNSNGYCNNFYGLFFQQAYEKISKISSTLDSYEQLLNIGIINHNRIVVSNDMAILPYHYATIKLLNYGILNQNNYNDEIYNEVNCRLNSSEYKQLYHNKGEELVPFIKTKLDNIIINDPMIDDTLDCNVTSNYKNKRFPS